MVSEINHIVLNSFGKLPNVYKLYQKASIWILMVPRDSKWYLNEPKGNYIVLNGFEKLPYSFEFYLNATILIKMVPLQITVTNAFRVFLMVS